jgi:hypothetical protein
MARGKGSSVAPRRGGRVAVYGALGVLARIVDIVVAIVALVIALGILLVVLKANPDNALVKAVHDAARWLVGPFADVFKLDDPKLMVAVNWGLAIVVYVVVGRVVSGLLRRPRP